MQRAFYAVALLALACLLIRAARTGLAGDFVDPINRITSQDEALYAHSAIAMAQHGDWLTPKFMGRLALYKPPLLIWASAFSARILGVSRLALRLPIALFCGLAICLVFLFAAESLLSWQAGAFVPPGRIPGLQPLVARAGRILHDRWPAGGLLHRCHVLPV